MFGTHSLASRAAALTALLVLSAAPVDAAPGQYRGYTGGYNPGYFSSQHGGYYPGSYSGRPGPGGYYPGYYTGYPGGYGSYPGGYYPGYFSDIHAESAYPAPVVTPPLVYAPSAVESSGGRSVLPDARELETLDPSETGGGAVVSVRVPSDAEVWFDGDETKQKGDERDFKSPPLPVGRLYHYEVRARWKEGGRTVDQTRTVPAGANRRTVVDFTRPDPDGK